MALDPYAPCPCGNGQKIKFCCSADIINELDKVLRAVEGDQRAAAVDQLNRLLQARPDNPALLAIKGSVQLSLNDFDNAEQTIAHFLAVDPKNPTALSQGAAISALRGNTRQAIERLQIALEESNGKINRQVHEVIHIIGDVLLSQGDILGAYGHTMLYASTADPRDEEAPRTLARIRLSSQLPLFLRQERFVEAAPDDAPWKAKFDEAFALAGKACWLKSCEQFIAMTERVPNEPKIIRNIAVLRGYLGDSSGATLWWRKYASLEAVPFEERIEAEALVQMLDSNLQRDQIDVVQAIYNLHDVDRAMERLLSDKRLVVENREAYLQELEENEVPPKAVFTLLDRPLPATGVDIKLEDLPQSVAEVLVYGRTTDRAPLVQLTSERTQYYAAAQQSLAEILGDSADAPTENILGQVPEDVVAMRVSLYPPRDIPREHFLALVEQAKRRVITEVWPNLKNRFLDGHTPAEVAGNLNYRVRLLATILQMEFNNGGKADFSFNDLRTQLGLPVLEAIDPATVDIMRLPAWRLSRLTIDKLTDEQLMAAFQRAVYYLDPPSLASFGEALLSRTSIHDKIDPREIYELLIRFGTSPQQSVEYALRAQEYAKTQRESPARFMLMELQARIALGDARNIQRLIEVLSTTYRNEPGIAQALMQIMVQLGIVTPDGRMRQQPGAEAAMLGGEPAGAGGLWTPGDPVAKPAEKKSSLWLPD
ncbi:MAG TPA: hypothetical protein VL096_05270 [Pirellulaceae bacterium]|nr:hypothetical protein [Pirellulaceae bacterium]